MSAAIDFNLGENLVLSPQYSFHVGKLQISEHGSTQNHDYLFGNYSLSSIYKFSKKSYLYSDISFNTTLTPIRLLYTNGIMVSDGLFYSNKTANSNFQSNQSINFGYRLNDLYNQLKINIGGLYSLNTNPLLSNTEIQDNVLSVRNEILNDKSTFNRNMFASTSKFLPLLWSTLKVRLNLSSSNYYNSINGTERLNNVNTKSVTFSWFSALNLPINFQSSINFTSNTFNQSSIQHSLFSTTKLLFKKNKLHGQFEYILHRPNMNYKKHNKIFNLDLKYELKENFLIRIHAVNLLNEQYIQSFQPADYFESTRKLEIQNSTILIGFDWKL